MQLMDFLNRISLQGADLGTLARLTENTASLLTYSTIAYQCLKNGNERPTMKKVMEQLQKALDTQLAPIHLWLDDDHDVRRQTGYYAQAFDMHKVKNNNKVESWRKALRNITDIAGWDVDKG
ncbi:hypothetical protein L1987_61898 [Smallanthus sonchifolius]|uniref:Uncharacterized protein n=1 Tax=Smallanthus sonchifolius TaxID=185202 RepID=A0ACB9C911_9ASTR|nr:hypothetical protein L1987_61898 [Smallanthus sonchifolius]